MTNYEERISELSDELDAFMEDYKDEAPETYKEEVAFLQEGFLDKMSGIIECVREAQTANYSGFDDLTKQADRVLCDAINWAYQTEESPYSESGIPSFAHREDIFPLLKDKQEEIYGFAGIVGPALDGLLRILGSDISLAKIKSSIKQPPPWSATLRPHPLSTPCARFCDDIPEWTATGTNDRATAVFEARCEISSDDINNPWGLKLSSNGSILALASMGGWKDRTPFIHYYLPNHEQDPHGSFMKEHVIKVDLASSIDDLLLDDQRRLIFAADDQRIKSYRCIEPPVNNNRSRKTQGVHTLDTKNFRGPLAMLPNGRFLRAGKKAIAVWELDSLPTHGESGTDIIGDEIDAEDMDTWRDDPEDIEPSSGSAPSTTMSLAVGSDEDEDGFVINKWHRHPSQASIMLSATDPASNRYSCYGIDVEAGGKVATRYLGHGGSVDGFSTSLTDPNVFLTSASDGHARLFDVRLALPVLTIASSRDLEPVVAELAHPDGVPCKLFFYLFYMFEPSQAHQQSAVVFVGTDTSQHIKLWDIRSQQPVYELATGNNGVAGLAWDAANNTLYAATNCSYVDRLGYHHDYRRARIPRQSAGAQAEILDEDSNDQGTQDNGDDNDDEEDEDEDDYESEDDDRCWPKRAYHAESYFGHVFDAGDHRFYKFAFKIEPNPDILPHYGSGSLDRGDYW